MFIPGYTDDKDVVLVELPARAVAAAGIDPRWLDLFDPEPIILTVDGKRLAFRRLREARFAYELGGSGQALIALFEGKRAQCLTGNIVGGSTFDLAISQARKVDIDFHDAYAEFLHRIFDSAVPLPVWAFCDMQAKWSRNRFSVSGPVLELASRKYVDGRDYADLLECRYTGEMFSTVRRRIERPEPIPAILNLLAPWNPAVTAASLYRRFLGIETNEVEVLLDTRGPNITELLKSRTDLTVDVGYPIIVRSDSFVLTLAFRGLGRTKSRLSLQMEADRYGTTATRAALHDISRRQARLIKDAPHIRLPWKASPPMAEEARIFARRAKLLPSTLDYDYVGDGIHCEPVVIPCARIFRLAASRITNYADRAAAVDFPVSTLQDLFSLPNNTAPVTDGLSPTAMRSLLFELGQHARHEFLKGKREAACFTAVEWLGFLAQRLGKRQMGYATAREMVIIVDQGLRRKHAVEMLSTLFNMQLSDCSRLATRYSKAIGHEPPEDEAVARLRATIEGRVQLPFVRNYLSTLKARVLAARETWEGGRTTQEIGQHLDVAYRAYWLLEHEFVGPLFRNAMSEADLSCLKQRLVDEAGYCPHCAGEFLRECAQTLNPGAAFLPLPDMDWVRELIRTPLGSSGEVDDVM